MAAPSPTVDRKSTRLNSSHGYISYAVFCLKKKMIDSMSRMPDARLLEGRFMTLNHGLSTPRERQAAADYLKTFAQDVNAFFFITRPTHRNSTLFPYTTLYR